jgi:hypothetical protein
VQAAGRAARGESGFAFDTPPLPPREEEYEARVYVLHSSAGGERRTLSQVGKALRFRVAGDGESGGRTAATGGKESAGRR